MTTPNDSELLDLIPPEAEIVRRIVEEVRLYPRIRRPLLRFLTAADFDDLISAVNENSANIRLILERMGVVENRIGDTDERLTSVEGRLTGVEERLTGVEERLTGVEGRLTGVEGRLTAVEGTVERIDGNVRSLQDSVGQLQGSVGQLQGSVGQLQGSVGQLRGDSYENKCAEEIEGILDGYLRNAVPADRERITAAFRDARGSNLITRDEFLDHYRPDIIARADHDDGETEGLAIVEVSLTFNRDDLEAASRRAELIGRVAGVPTAAYLVTHHEWPAEMDTAARDLGVTVIRHAIPEYPI